MSILLSTFPKVFIMSSLSMNVFRDREEWKERSSAEYGKR
jgi:hypothetical protein